MTQAVEIESMLSWLKDWDVTAPSGDPSVGTGQSGTVNAGELAALEGFTGEEFEQQWLRLMIASTRTPSRSRRWRTRRGSIRTRSRSRTP